MACRLGKDPSAPLSLRNSTYQHAMVNMNGGTRPTSAMRRGGGEAPCWRRCGASNISRHGRHVRWDGSSAFAPQQLVPYDEAKEDGSSVVAPRVPPASVHRAVRCSAERESGPYDLDREQEEDRL